MPEWLTEAVNAGHGPELHVMWKRLAAALLFGWAVAIAYRLTQGRRDDFRPGFAVTLVMLTVILTLITQVIGNSVARAFSLVGSLAVVRFRTPVKDTRDTAFVILAVAVGMAAGADMYLLALAGVPTVALAALVLPRLGIGGGAGARHKLVVRVSSGCDPEVALAPLFAKYLRSHRCDGSESAEKGSALDLTYTVRLRDAGKAVALVRELLGLEGVMGAELRRRG
jgi:hypothetical protein